MRKIKILTDSTADLSKELLQQYDIDVLPLYVNIDNKAYRDLYDLNACEMYELAEKTGSHPKTSTSSIQEMYDFFMKYIKEDQDVIFSGIAKGMSSSFQYAHMVNDMIEEKHPEYAGRLHIVDSANLSTGIGLLLLKMAKWRNDGLTVEEIVEKAEEIKPKIRAQFCVEGLDYLHKGGRCSATSKIFGTMLRIKPMIKVVDGKMGVWKKPIGSFKKALGIMVDEFLECFDNVDKEFVFITHSEGSQHADYIRTKIAQVTDQIENLYETKAGCVISSHCGKGTIGILYIMK